MKQKAMIITGYVEGESYGLLGPQMAATIIEAFSSFTCIVLAVRRSDDRLLLEKAIFKYFGSQPPLIGFSMLGGRNDLVTLAGTLKEKGATTILAGPQSDVDYKGEVENDRYPHRFRGYSDFFTFALHGPAQQILPYLHDPHEAVWRKTPGLIMQDATGRWIENRAAAWDEAFLNRVNWANLHRLYKDSFVPLAISTGQVVQQIGCPHAANMRELEIPYPLTLDKTGEKTVKLKVKGCAFCDVAVDKSICGHLRQETVLKQIACLPDRDDGRKIPFELVNENPLPGLENLLHQADHNELCLSQVHLTMRADWFIRGERHLNAALDRAASMGVGIVLTSMGFESFDDGILHHLNKGITVETNLAAVKLIRSLKRTHPHNWGYLPGEGGHHGFIHPTPWDTPERDAAMQQLMVRHRLPLDILPPHSTPLIIHHASALADWIRTIEEREKVRFERNGAIISWWQLEDRFLLDSDP